MKKKGLFLIGILFISALGVVSFQSCDKDTYSYLDVTVVDQVTGRVVPAAYVEIGAEGSPIGANGYTNENGVFSAKFSAPAVFDIKAQMIIIDTPDHPLNQWYLHRDGASSIRLKESETVSATVYIDEELHSDRISQ